jgi:hypothetical protein
MIYAQCLVLEKPASPFLFGILVQLPSRIVLLPNYILLMESEALGDP